jgi:hypothetical protein
MPTFQDTKDRAKIASGGVCNNCGRGGHFSRDCPRPNTNCVCYACGEAGHMSRECPSKPKPVYVNALASKREAEAAAFAEQRQLKKGRRLPDPETDPHAAEAAARQSAPNMFASLAKSLKKPQPGTAGSAGVLRAQQVIAEQQQQQQQVDNADAPPGKGGAAAKKSTSPEANASIGGLLAYGSASSSDSDSSDD